MIPWRIKRRSPEAKRPWRERFTVGQVMTWTAAVSILTASLVAGYYALTILYHNKLVDTWAIMFLELEHEGTALGDRLSTLGAGLAEAGDSGDAVLRLTSSGHLEAVKGGFEDDLRLSDFNLAGASLPDDLPPLAVLSYGGEAYLAQRLAADAEGDAGRLAFRRIRTGTFALLPARAADQGALYVLTREGRVLYTSDPGITEANVASRPLVRRFISAPIKQGQLELTSAEGEALYGFFTEVAKTNIVLFSEVSKAAAMASVRQVVLRFLAVLAAILVAAAVALQVPLARITGPVRELAQLALSVGQGHFDVSPRLKGFGELSVLASAFSSMAAGLVERDRKVAALMREQAEKARLEGELAIARRIQENLLPSGPLPKEAGLTVAAEYIAAEECAGDWYHYSYDSVKRETVVVIADVSGHGAGSSMFTAMIAGLFEDCRSRDDAPFDMEGFARKTDAVMRRLGRRQWHATMMIARYVAGSDQLDLLVAGHPPPIIKVPGASEAGARPMVFPGSSALGMDVDFNPAQRRVPFPKGSSLLVYTDGLTEAANPRGKMFGRKRAREIFLQGKGEPHEALARLFDGWRGYLDGAAPDDDVCVLVMSAA